MLVKLMSYSWRVANLEIRNKVIGGHSMKIMHVGVPTTRIQENEIYNEDLKVYLTDPEKTEFFIEYLRFESGSPLPDCLQMRTHIAIAVENFDELIKKYKPIFGPYKCNDKLTIAFVEKDHTLFEIMNLHE